MRDALRASKKKSVSVLKTPSKHAVLPVVGWRTKLVADRESPPGRQNGVDSVDGSPQIRAKSRDLRVAGGACWRSPAPIRASSVSTRVCAPGKIDVMRDYRNMIQELAMNDPHVDSLIFQVKHGSLVDYSQAEPLFREEPALRLEVKDKQARFEMKEHYATEDEARKAVEEYIRLWELDACLRHRDPDFFRLEFNKSQIIDRNPGPGLSVHFRAGTPTFSATLGPVRPNYPVPPSNIGLDANVRTMYQRYMGYRRGHEKLTEMAHFCLRIRRSENVKRLPKSTKLMSQFSIKSVIFARIRVVRKRQEKRMVWATR